MSEAASVEVDTSVDPIAQSDAPDDSLAAHEAQYGKGQPAPVADDASAEVPEQPKHRAKSQRAGAGDYEDIAKYTKLLRETENAIDGFALERADGESDRVYNLRKRVEIAKLAQERRVAAAPAQTPAPAIAQPAPVVPPAPSTFTQPEPKIEDFANAPDPYLALVRATAKWDRDKEQFDRDEQAKQVHATQSAKDAQAQAQARVQTYFGRVDSYKAKAPDFDTVTADLQARMLPGVLLEALVSHDKGPELVYYLGQHPDIADDLYVTAAALPATADSVALLQRRLAKLSTPVGVTGATAGVQKPIPASRPPTPVRTVPTPPGDELPGDESSLADHEKAFGPKRRRR